MIVLDIETSGLDTGRCGIWQIGAIDLETNEEFLEEARIDDEDIIDPVALKITGKTEEELRDKNKQSQKELIEKFLKWTTNVNEKMVLGHHVGWDNTFIASKSMKYGLNELFQNSIAQKGMDLHTIVQIKFLQINEKFKLKDSGRSDMSLPRVAEFCGVEDKRMGIQYDGTILQEGEVHDALTDCRLTAECYFRLVEGKNLFPEFSKFNIPYYLKNDNL